MILYITKQLNNTLIAVDATDYEKIKKIKVGSIYQCEVKQPRNLGFHRKFFALINMVYENQEMYNNIDHLRKELIIEAGYYNERITLQGEVLKEARSISFAKMKQDDFNELYDRVVDVIVKYFHFEKKLIIDNIEQFY